MNNAIFTQSFLAPTGHYKSDKELVPIDELVTLPNTHAVEGVLLMTVNGVPLITREMWDVVDCLWADFVNAIEELDVSPKATFHFPDQPIEVSLEKIGSNQLRVSVHGRSVVADRREFCITILERASETFDKLAKLRQRDKQFHLEKAARARGLIQRFFVE